MIKFDKKKLRFLRKKNKLSYSQLSMRIFEKFQEGEALSVMCLKNWENGVNQPNFTNTIKLSRVLGVSVESFVVDAK